MSSRQSCGRHRRWELPPRSAVARALIAGCGVSLACGGQGGGLACGGPSPCDFAAVVIGGRQGGWEAADLVLFARCG
jgi:hypothetical protein